MPGREPPGSVAWPHGRFRAQDVPFVSTSFAVDVLIGAATCAVLSPASGFGIVGPMVDPVPIVSLECRLLGAVTYPSEKQELLRRAQAIGTPDSVRQAILRLPFERLRSRADLVAAVDALTHI